MKTLLSFIVGVTGKRNSCRSYWRAWGVGPVCALLAAALVLSTPMVRAASMTVAVSPLLAPIVARSFSVAVALTTQTITFTAPGNKTFGVVPFTVNPTASSGLPVRLSSLTNAVCTVNGNTVTIVAVGTCTLRAAQDGDATYAQAPNLDRTFTVAKATQTVTFATLGNQPINFPPFTVSASASSGLPVSFSSLTAPVCTVSGNTVTIIATGTCTVQASQAGDANFNAAANVNRSFTVAKVSQTIAFAALSPKAFGDAPLTVSASASSGLPVSFSSLTAPVCTVSGNTVTIVAVGTCNIQASQIGDATYAAAPNVSRTFAVAKASQLITFVAPSDRALSSGPFTVGANASSGLAVTFTSLTTSICTVNGTTVTLVAVGTCTIRAAQAGNASYSAAPNVSQSFAITGALLSQTISFGALSPQTLGPTPFTVGANASSGLAVTFTSLTAPVCTGSGNTVTLVAVGTCTIRASQSGNASYNPAPSVDQSFTVGPASPTTGIAYAYDSAGRLTAVYNGNGDAAQYVYDAADNITQINRFAATALSVIQFSPETALVGATVTIYGTGFNATPSANAVKFNGTVASVSSGTTSQLVVTVPAGTTTGPISVTNGVNTATSTRSFSVSQPVSMPTISGFTPTAGTVGTLVTINGTNFDPQPFRDTVRFNATAAPVTGATTTTLSTSVPSGASSGKIAVTTSFGAQGTATSTADFFVLPAPYTAASIGATGRIVVDGSTLAVNITTPGKIALILFDGVIGQNIGLGIGGVTLTPGGSTATVSVLKPNGSPLDAPTAFNAGASLDLPPLPAPGIYTIMIVPASTAQLSATLTASSDITGAFAGATITFNAARVGQNGRYTFSGTAGNPLDVLISNDTIASARIEMRKPDGTVLTSSTVGTSGGQIVVPSLPMSGIYTLFANPLADNVGQLDLRIDPTGDLTTSDASVGAVTLNRNGSYSFPVSFTVKNVGAAISTSWYDVAYLSSDATLHDSDPVLAFTSHSGLAANGSYVVNATYETPTTAVPGAHTLFLKVDGRGGTLGGKNTDNGYVAEANEANNTQALSITLPGKPDLSVSGGTVGAITIHQNGSYIIPVSFTVTNVGGAPVLPSWWDMGYLSSDAMLDDDDKLAGNTYHDTALPANGSYVVNATYGAPIGTPSGTRTLFLKADGRSPLIDGGRNTDLGSVAEASEANNVQALTITLPGKPDLTVTSATVGVITLNQDGSYSFPVTYTVKNVGQLTANVDDFFHVWWDMGYLSDDGTFDENDPRVSGVPGDNYSSPFHNTPLAAGASYTTTATYVTSTTTTPGIHTLFIKTNGHPSVSSATGPLWEEDTTNNTKALAITLPGKPDLTVTSANAGTITVNRDGSYSFPVTYTVKNVGGTAAQPAWVDMAYLSVDDGNLDDNDFSHTLGGRATALAAGASYTATGAITTLATTTPGAATLFVKADGNATGFGGGTNTDDGNLAEASETNNTRAVALTLPVKPDLTVTSASIGAITISGSNYRLPVTFTVKNVGGSTAQPTWEDWAYLSVNGVLVGLPAVNGANSRSTALAAGATYTKTVTYTAPTSTGPGTYTLFIKADGDFVPTGAGVVTEANETNNTASISVGLP